MRVAIVISGEFRVCKTLPEMGPTVRKTEKPTARETSSPWTIYYPPAATRDNMSVKMVCGLSIRYVLEVFAPPPLYQGVQSVRHSETQSGK